MANGTRKTTSARPAGRPLFGDISLPEVPEYEEELERPFPFGFLYYFLPWPWRGMFSPRRRPNRPLTLLDLLGGVLLLAAFLYALGGLVLGVLVFGRWEWLWFLRMK